MPLFASDTKPLHVTKTTTIGSGASLYLKSNRFVIKIVQLIIGFILCGLLCGPWYGRNFFEHGCFYHAGRLGFCSGLNFVILVINIIVLILNLANLSNIYAIERVYNIVCSVLFLVASVLILWHILYNFDNNYDAVGGWLIVSTVLLVVMFVLFLMDVKIQHGTAPNYHAQTTTAVF